MQPFAWLEDQALAFALHAAIDDATGTVVAAVFRPIECFEGYSCAMQEGNRNYWCRSVCTMTGTPFELMRLLRWLTG
nr:hypothetical protein [Paenibacillus pinihumi]